MKSQIQKWYHVRMNGQHYICNKCRTIFTIEQLSCSLVKQEREVVCPACGSSETDALPVWAPIGFHSHEEVREWEYQCEDCRKTFKLPVPESPSQERNLVCPACGKNHIHRLTFLDGVPMYCG